MKSKVSAEDTLRDLLIGCLRADLLDRVRLADALGPAEQAVRVAGVGLAAHLLDRVDEAFGGGCGLLAPGDVLVTVGRAELGRQVLLAAHALGRNPFVEVIGPVVTFYWNVRGARRGLLKTRDSG